MNRRLPCLMACLALTLGGCTSAAWYEAGKRSAEAECRKQAMSAAQDCLTRLNKKSHEDYEKERAAGR